MRGATIAGMIVVNDPGTWSAVFPQLLHAEWNGWTYTDTIFPFFLFLVGVSLALSLGRRRASAAESGVLYRHLARRAAVLVGLGLLLNVVSALAFHTAHVRFPGVLQRIGVCVLLAGSVFVAGGIRGSALAAGILLASSAWLLGVGPLDPTASVAARVDRIVFGVHTWKPGWDPEGLLSTLPAIATTLLGAMAGERVRTVGSPRRAAAELAAAGTGAFAAGLLWGRVLPLNKNLWTSSYAVAMSGLAALALALAIEAVDVRGWRRWAAPFVWLGRNAIAVFTLSVLGAIALIAVKIPGVDGRPRSVWSTIYRTVFDHFADPRVGSLLFALAYLAFWTLVCGVLYRRRVFLRI